MAFNKTESDLLRRVFGYNDPGSPVTLPTSLQGTPIVPGTREWRVAVDLHNTGTAVIVKRGDTYYVKRKVNEQGIVPLAENETSVPKPGGL